MQSKIRERWQDLCELAANEQDPFKMLELVEEINRLLPTFRARAVERTKSA
jgi:hypothetical protein